MVDSMRIPLLAQLETFLAASPEAGQEYAFVILDINRTTKASYLGVSMFGIALNRS